MCCTMIYFAAIPIRHLSGNRRHTQTIADKNPFCLADMAKQNQSSLSRNLPFNKPMIIEISNSPEYYFEMINEKLPAGHDDKSSIKPASAKL